jgi:hypothetical protein
MKIKDMVKNANVIAGQGAYNVDSLLGYFDECIDEINTDLSINLPLVSAVYANNFELTDSELEADYSDNDDDNNYGRIPDSFIRNYMLYSAIFKIMRDEDEDYESYGPKQMHARRWYQKFTSLYADYLMEDTEAISIGGDADEIDSITEDDTGVGFYNPMFEYD